MHACAVPVPCMPSEIPSPDRMEAFQSVAWTSISTTCSQGFGCYLRRQGFTGITVYGHADIDARHTGSTREASREPHWEMLSSQNSVNGHTRKQVTKMRKCNLYNLNVIKIPWSCSSGHHEKNVGGPCIPIQLICVHLRSHP